MSPVKVFMVMANKRYSLIISKIPEAVDEFAAVHDSFTVNKSFVNNEFRYEFVGSDGKVKRPGILVCYILQDGRVSFNIQGSPIYNKICDECRNFIISQTQIPDISQKTLTVRHIPKEDVECFLKLQIENGVTCEMIDSKCDSIEIEASLCGDYGARMHLSYYTNETLFLQGVLTEFFVILAQDVLGLTTETPDNIIETVFEIKNTSKEVIAPDLSCHIQDLTQISHGSVIRKFISSTLTLINSGVCVGDYGCCSFGILKALDALMRKRMQEDSPIESNYFGIFKETDEHVYKFSSSITTYDHNLGLKSALEEAYTLYHKHRHTTFHVDSVIESSRILSFDDALDIIKEALRIINRICNNW